MNHDNGSSLIILFYLIAVVIYDWQNSMKVHLSTYFLSLFIIIYIHVKCLLFSQESSLFKVAKRVCVG